MADESGPGQREVELWLNGVRSDLERVTNQIDSLAAEQNRLREREALLAKLLRSLENSPASDEGTKVNEVPAPSRATRVPVTDGSILDYVRNGVLEILREKDGGPMHINDIHARFVRKGYKVPGAGRPANLTAHLARAEGIVSPTRGFYAITAVGEPSVTRGRRNHS